MGRVRGARIAADAKGGWMARWIVWMVATLAVAIPAGQTLVGQTLPSFDVSSVRQNTTVSSNSSLSSTPTRLTITNTPLGFVMLHAYDLRAHQLVDAPDWTWSTGYDITATYPAGTPDAQVRAMLQRLLADRLQLAVRR